MLLLLLTSSCIQIFSLLSDNLSSCPESSCNSYVRNSENNSAHILLNTFILTNNRMNPSVTVTFSASRKKNQNQDSPNSDSRSLLLHYQSQSSYQEENSSDFRTDDNLWMQDLENMQDDSIR